VIEEGKKHCKNSRVLYRLCRIGASQTTEKAVVVDAAAEAVEAVQGGQVAGVVMMEDVVGEGAEVVTMEDVAEDGVSEVVAEVTTEGVEEAEEVEAEEAEVEEAYQALWRQIPHQHFRT